MIRNSPLNPLRSLTPHLKRLAFRSVEPAAEPQPFSYLPFEHVPQRLELVQRHGDFSLAYTTAVQHRLRHFGNAKGYVAFERHSLSNQIFVLGDPVAAPEDRERLIRQFVARHPRATFCQISAATARIVEKLGFQLNEMGVDTVLPLPEYDFRGQDKRWLRQAASWASSRGYSIREAALDGTPDEAIEAVSEAWRRTRIIKRREVRFLNRPLVTSVEGGTRRFCFFDATERLLAFVFFDPLYRHGKLIGYVACNKRRHPDAPSQAEQAIMKHAIEVFQREGCQEVRLGLSPLAGIEDTEFRANRVFSFLFRSSFDSRLINQYFYNLQGHASYKRKFRGREEKVYLATKGGLNLVRLWALLKLCKVL